MIVAEVPPAPVPVTTPDVFTVAEYMLLLDHVPPEMLAERLVCCPTHTLVAPEITAPVLMLTVVVT